jgi:UbiD family decarboxylase
MERLRRDGELLVVERQVDPRHELAAVTDKVQRTLDKPLLFERVSGTALPVLTNIYGSRERLAGILGIASDEFCRHWGRLTEGDGFAGPFTAEVETPADLVHGALGDLPLITYAERDAGPYFTSAIFVAREPESGAANLSFHRAMYVNDQELRVRLAPGHHLTQYHEKAEALERPLEAAMLIGPPAEMFLAAAAPIPYHADELHLASRLAGRTMEMRPCRFVDLSVPVDTEIVIEGRFLPHQRRPEGPFGEFMGYYVPVGDNAVFEVLGVSWRPDAIFHSILCGSPEEVLTLELSVAANVYQRVSAVLPGIIDVACLPFVLHTVIKIRQQYEGHGRQVLLAAMGAEPTWAKVCTVVDEDVDIYDMDDVMWAILTRAPLDDSIMHLRGIPSFYRDPHQDHWGRLAIDATAPFARRHQFERKRIPGADRVDLDDYL